jgi:hypothetical protein
MKTPEERRRDNAQGEIPRRDGGGQMGSQVTSDGGTSQPEESRNKNETGRDRKPDMPDDDGGRVPNR